MNIIRILTEYATPHVRLRFHGSMNIIRILTEYATYTMYNIDI